MAPSSPPSSRYWRRCGSVRCRKIAQGVAPSIWAASTVSMGRDCKPASRMSIMNGVHCHTRETTTAARGAWDSRSSCGAALLPKSEQGQAQPDEQAGEHHRDGEDDGGEDRLPQVRVGEDGDVVFQPGEGRLAGAKAVPVQERDEQRHHERKLGYHDEEDQGREQRRTPCPGHGAFTGWRTSCGFGCGVSRSGDTRRCGSHGILLRFGWCYLYLLPIFWAASWPLAKASATVPCPAMAELTPCETFVPRAANSGMPTNWIPTAGRGWVPGFLGSAFSMANRSAVKKGAAFWNSAFS